MVLLLAMDSHLRKNIRFVLAVCTSILKNLIRISQRHIAIWNCLKLKFKNQNKYDWLIFIRGKPHIALWWSIQNRNNSVSSAKPTLNQITSNIIDGSILFEIYLHDVAASLSVLLEWLFSIVINIGIKYRMLWYALYYSFDVFKLNACE